MTHQLFQQITCTITLPFLYFFCVCALVSLGAPHYVPTAMQVFQFAQRASLIHGPVSLLNSWFSLRAGNGPSVTMVALHNLETCACQPVFMLLDKVRACIAHGLGNAPLE